MRKNKDEYSAAETKKRMEAALRGSRIAGHKEMKDVQPKKRKPKAKAK